MVVEIPHPSAGAVKLAGIPFKLSRTPAQIAAHPPRLGEHTEEVLHQTLGYGAEEIVRLREEGVT
jgi:formyl-CoA transferase